MVQSCADERHTAVSPLLQYRILAANRVNEKKCRVDPDPRDQVLLDLTNFIIQQKTGLMQSGINDNDGCHNWKKGNLHGRQTISNALHYLHHTLNRDYRSQLTTRLWSSLEQAQHRFHVCNQVNFDPRQGSRLIPRSTCAVKTSLKHQMKVPVGRFH